MKPSNRQNAADPETMREHLRVLTEDIGVRLAGSDGERAAADYIARQCRSHGVSTILEDFPVWERRVESETLDVMVNGTWQSFPCSLFGGAPSTDGATLEAPLVYFASQTEYRRSDLSHLTGRAVVHLGCHIATREAYRALMAARPAFLLFVDTRYPGEQPLADGLFPAYVREMGAHPTVNVAFMDAWEWKRAGATRARLCVRGGRLDSRSQNVIAEIPGSDPEAGALYVGAHHDTQAGSVGADDNAVGCAAMLELTRLFSRRRPRRTLRLVSFGAEEQLSVGSAQYVRRHRDDIERHGRFMFNFDSFGSLLGWTEVTINAPAPCEQWLTETMNAADIYFRPSRAVVPFTDQFPFAAAGVPGLWLRRCNCETGVFYHHRADNTSDRVCPRTMALHIDAAAAFLTRLSEAPLDPPEWSIPAQQQEQIDAVWQSHYGGWSEL